MRTNSLSFRLIFTSAVVAIVLLVSAAFLLAYLFQSALERNFDARLRAILDGVSVLEKWRRAGKKMPVLILTARDRWSDKVAGFDAGADDYVVKPFQMEEVLARMRALLRRSAGHATSELTCGPMVLDTKSARVTVNGTAIKLTSLEFRLLSYLMHHGGKVVSRTELVEHLYDQDFDRDSNTIEVFIGRLRKKLGVDVLHTIRGMGYCVSEPDNAN